MLVFLQYPTVNTVKDEKETTVEKVLFSGKESGLSFEELDEKMQSWGRKKFGDKYARELWRNELLELKTLATQNGELHMFAFPIQCALCRGIRYVVRRQRKAGRWIILLRPFLDC